MSPFNFYIFLVPSCLLLLFLSLSPFYLLLWSLFSLAFSICSRFRCYIAPLPFLFTLLLLLSSPLLLTAALSAICSGNCFSVSVCMFVRLCMFTCVCLCVSIGQVRYGAVDFVLARDRKLASTELYCEDLHCKCCSLDQPSVCVEQLNILISSPNYIPPLLCRNVLCV